MVSFIGNLASVNTTPGANNVFAPPAGWEGDESEYIRLIRYRYTDMQYRQQINVVARRMINSRRGTVPITGPYAEAAQKSLTGVIARRKQVAAQEAAEEETKARA